MTQVLERRTFSVVRQSADGFEPVLCPTCGRRIADVSGAWASLRARCKRCGVIVEAKRIK